MTTEMTELTENSVFAESPDLDAALLQNVVEPLDADRLRTMSQRFRRDGIVMVTDLLPLNLRDRVRQEALRLLDAYAERRDLRLATTGHTRRSMSVVTSEQIAENSGLLRSIYASQSLRSGLESIAHERLHDCPKADEEFLISRHEKAGDTHGWHWGDYSYAMIWVLIAPGIDQGGQLQCVPHTNWNKSAPNITRYLVENPIHTYHFQSGDVYFLRTDTTLHRTLPLREDVTRVMLNMTFAADRDLASELVGDDRWWSDASVTAAAELDPYLG